MTWGLNTEYVSTHIHTYIDKRTHTHIYIYIYEKDKQGRISRPQDADLLSTAPFVKRQGKYGSGSPTSTLPFGSLDSPFIISR